MVAAIVWLATCFGAFHIFDTVWTSAACPQRFPGHDFVRSRNSSIGVWPPPKPCLETGSKGSNAHSQLKRPTIINYPTQPTQNDTKRINKFKNWKKKLQNDVKTKLFLVKTMSELPHRLGWVASAGVARDSSVWTAARPRQWGCVFWTNFRFQQWEI